MNESIDLILHRRSVRSFHPDPIPDETVKVILQAACAAPYGGPEPPRRFFVVTSEETRKKLLDLLKAGQKQNLPENEPNLSCWNTFFAEAPVVVAVFFKPTAMAAYPEHIQQGIGVASAACAIENMLLAALALGLGATWVGPSVESKKDFESFFDAQAPWEFLALVPIGKPKEQNRREQPRPIDDVVFFDA